MSERHLSGDRWVCLSLFPWVTSWSMESQKYIFKKRDNMSNNLMRTSEKLGPIQSQTSIEKKMARPIVIDYYSGEPPTIRRRKHCYTRALVSLADIMLNERSQTPESVCTVPFTCGSGPAMVTVRKTLAP